jgi:hypothetical protein
MQAANFGGTSTHPRVDFKPERFSRFYMNPTALVSE